jgi:hypothetical protein
MTDPDASETTIATLQYALKRGIESVYQLEESELLAEPLPDRKTRRGVLFYEATEGGAGVLTRLVHDENALAHVARAALKVLHFAVPDAGQPLPALGALHDVEGTQCVAGCYRCMLSYYNQPDHPVIDRRDATARSLLLRLAAVQTRLDGPTPAAVAPVGNTSSPAANTDHLAAAPAFDAAQHGLPPPSGSLVKVSGIPVLALWRSRRVAAVDADTDAAPLRDSGLTVVVWPADTGGQAAAADLLRLHLQ